MQQVAALLSEGVPYDTAMEWSWVRRLAFIVAIGEAKGNHFDWSRMEWIAEE